MLKSVLCLKSRNRLIPLGTQQQTLLYFGLFHSVNIFLASNCHEERMLILFVLFWFGFFLLKKRVCAHVNVFHLKKLLWLIESFRFSFIPLSTNPTRWSNTLKQFVGNSQQIVWVYLNILWGWHLKGYYIYGNQISSMTTSSRQSSSSYLVNILK